MIYAHTGSYSGAIAGEGAFLGMTAILVLATVRRRANLIIRV